MSPLEYWFRSTDRLKRHGRPDRTLTGGLMDPNIPPTSNRNTLVYGTYEPDASTTGVLPGTTLTQWSETTPATNTFTVDSSFNGEVVSNKIIYGDLNVTATGDVIFQNCKLVGGNHIPSGDSGIITGQQQRGGTGVVKLIDCTLDPRRPSLNRDGARGARIELYRCDTSKVIDGGGFFVETKYGLTETNVIMKGNYVHDLVYFYPDYINGVSGAARHTDGNHNDGVQIQGGANILLEGNSFHMSSYKGPGSGDNPVKPWLHTIGQANGAGTIIQKQSGTAPLANVVVRKNYYWGGLSHINLKPGTYEVSENVHHRMTAYRPTGAAGDAWSGYWIRGDNQASTFVTGVNVGMPSNKWADTGGNMLPPRTSGVTWDS